MTQNDYETSVLVNITDNLVSEVKLLKKNNLIMESSLFQLFKDNRLLRKKIYDLEKKVKINDS